MSRKRASWHTRQNSGLEHICNGDTKEFCLAPWVIGGVSTDMSHLNYGYIDRRPSEEEFIEKIIKLGHKENRPFCVSK